MSHERAPRSPEVKSSQNHELGKLSKELESKRSEKAAEATRKTSHERAAEAQKTIEQEAISGKERAPLQGENRSQIHHSTRQTEKDISFQTTMNHVRRSLNKQERAFSKVIHQPAIEKVSEVAGKTIARPSGIIGGTIAAFLGLLSIYGIARFAGFSLSGSEMPFLLVIGFAAGLFIEWIIKSTSSLFSSKS